MSSSSTPAPRGRATPLRPLNRFEPVHSEPDPDDRGELADGSLPDRDVRTEFLADRARSIISENDSADVGFRYSLNPYRGCEHGCAYCYARPTHEYLGFDAGLDFETKIVVKHDAAALFRDWLNRRDWEADVIAFSGVTDCYQPAERRFALTRACLQVAVEARQPVGIVTKNALVCRDLDLLRQLHEFEAVHVSISVTSLDPRLTRQLEPRTSPPASRLQTIHRLSEAGIPVRVLVAPVIPGLTDSEIPAILDAASRAGARTAAWQMLRLPLSVEPIFVDWIERTWPAAAERVLTRIRAVRDGKLNDNRTGRRMRGTGPLAKQIDETFQVFSRRCGLDQSLPSLKSGHFRPPTSTSGQLHLF